MTPLLELKDIAVCLPGSKGPRTILSHLNFSLQAGEKFFLYGPNGSGKSTFLRLLAGEIWATSGAIFWKGDPSPLVAKKMVALVSMARQEKIRRQCSFMTGREFLYQAGAESFMSFRQKTQITSFLTGINFNAILDEELGRLSLGQLRLLLLVHAFQAMPEVLLLDEAMEGLDQTSRSLFFEILNNLGSETAVIFASHRSEAPQHSSFAPLYMDAGKLVAEKPARLGSTTSRFCKSACLFHEKRQEIFTLQNASVYLDRKLVLKNIDWQMLSGEHWQIRGANGSGKSTFLRLLAGDEFAATGGEARVWASRLGRCCATLEEKRKTVSLVSDLSEAMYAYALTGLECILSGIDNTIGLYRTFTPAEKRHAQRIIMQFFEATEAAVIVNESIRNLSSGQLRRVFLARAMMNDPEVLLLDEPCSGLDEIAREQFLHYLGQLVQTGKTHLVLVTHFEEDSPWFINRCGEMIAGELTQAI